MVILLDDRRRRVHRSDTRLSVTTWHLDGISPALPKQPVEMHRFLFLLNDLSILLTQPAELYLSPYVLYLMLLPFAALAYFAYKAFALVWNAFGGTVAAKYAVVVFGVGGLLIVVYLMMVVRQIYKELIAPKLASRYSTSGPSEDRK